MARAEISSGICGFTAAVEAHMDGAHAACPVPIGIIKAVEVEAGLALPADVTIRLSKSDEWA